MSKIVKNGKNRYSGAQSQKGERKVKEILLAAQTVLTEVGYQGFTMRKIAAKAGIAIGNLHYYYKNKDDILHDLLDETIKVYETAFDHILQDENKTDADKFSEVIKHIVLDLGTQKTTRFFPELWALAKHDEYAAEGMAQLYQRARKYMRVLIQNLNPLLTEDQCRLVSLFVSASLEGQTMFVGYGKPWSGVRELLARFAASQLTEMIINLNPDDFEASEFKDRLPLA